MRNKEFIEGIHRFLNNQPVFESQPMSCKATEKNFKSSMKILAIPQVDDLWKDIYQDKQLIVAQQAMVIRQGFRKSIPVGWSTQKIEKITQIQAQIVYQNMLKTNLEMHIKKLQEAIMKAKARTLTQMKLKESLKEKYALCKNTTPDTTELQALRGKCIRLLQSGSQ